MSDSLYKTSLKLFEKIDLPKEEAKELAFSLSEISESVVELANILLPQLKKENQTSEVVEELLLDIQHEIYHIDYHIHSCKHLLPNETDD
jgi:hypothetical protein